MSARKYSYAIELEDDTGRWFTLAGLNDVPLQYANGFVDARREAAGPTRPTRIVRSDGKIMYSHDGREECSIGLVAGWPSPEQYEAAAARALEKARRIRSRRSLG